MKETTQKHTWTFQRMGGLDQVVINSAEDIAHLDELDPKLWAALSCPTEGLEFDAKTLALLDIDNDQRIRVPEVIEAIKWLRGRLTHLDSLMLDQDALPLSVINDSDEEGHRLQVTAKAILTNINKPQAESITLDDLKQSTLLNSNNLYNGDGILPPNEKLGADMVAFIKDAILVLGGVKDASGVDGINADIAKGFTESIANWLKWHQGVGAATTPLGEDTAEVWQIMQSLNDKIDDYFMRTQLASYAPQAEASLNVDEKYIVPTENGLLEDKALSELPLSKVTADKPLELTSGINPIWRAQIERLNQLIKPFLSDPATLTQDEWETLKKAMSPYSVAVESKPALAKVSVTTAPTMTVDKLGESRLIDILDSQILAQFLEQAAIDSKTPAAAADVSAVERLIIYHKHMYRLLMNFVSFHDFFDPERRAAFQIGKLYIDGRCCALCIPVSDVAKHTTLANYSELFLLYCECARKNPPANGAQEKKTVVAAMTAGDADFLLDGRNGIFVDNQGHDWDAKVVKIITKPISVSQAIWDPYKRLGRFITDQINKWAGSKDQALVDATSKAAANIQTPAAAPAESSAAKFDIGRSVGIFAAIGLALGAIGTALASIARSLLELTWWQLPLVFVAIFLLISGPSVIMAWLKLRQRTLAPLLEASGWAINGKIKINLFLGRELTSRAELPKNASRTLMDPTMKPKNKFWIAFWLALLIGIIISGGWIWYKDYFNLRSDNRTEPQTTTQMTTPTVEPAPAEPAASDAGSQ